MIIDYLFFFDQESLSPTVLLIIILFEEESLSIQKYPILSSWNLSSLSRFSISGSMYPFIEFKDSGFMLSKKEPPSSKSYGSSLINNLS
jgi:hypothetical protein